MEPQQSLENVLSSKLSSDSVSLPLQFSFLTLFPEIFGSVLGASLLGKAQKKGLVSYSLVNIRDFALDKHRTTDDTPYGGGEGMVLKVDVLYAAWESACVRPPLSGKRATLLLSPQGELLTQDLAKELSSYSELILVCGHYEGVDERFIDLCVDREISIGDYVLTGGELPALVVADAVTRLIPGVVGNERSLTQDSLENSFLKYPQYTRPREFKGLEVPDILLSGDHEAISLWRQAQSRERTRRKRPDLLSKAPQVKVRT
jgi:tRNA (guanine37-N1)-methyltransferase